MRPHRLKWQKKHNANFRCRHWDYKGELWASEWRSDRHVKGPTLLFPDNQLVVYRAWVVPMGIEGMHNLTNLCINCLVLKADELGKVRIVFDEDICVISWITDFREEGNPIEQAKKKALERMRSHFKRNYERKVR